MKLNIDIPDEVYNKIFEEGYEEARELYQANIVTRAMTHFVGVAIGLGIGILGVSIAFLIMNIA